MKKAMKPAIPAKVMKRVENSMEDRARDKKMGVKEGSPKDMAMDNAEGRRMMAGGGTCSCGKKMKDGKCMGCGKSSGQCTCGGKK